MGLPKSLHASNTTLLLLLCSIYDSDVTPERRSPSSPPDHSYTPTALEEFRYNEIEYDDNHPTPLYESDGGRRSERSQRSHREETAYRVDRPHDNYNHGYYDDDNRYNGRCDDYDDYYNRRNYSNDSYYRKDYNYHDNQKENRYLYERGDNYTRSDSRYVIDNSDRYVENGDNRYERGNDRFVENGDSKYTHGDVDDDRYIRNDDDDRYIRNDDDTCIEYEHEYFRDESEYLQNDLPRNREAYVNGDYHDDYDDGEFYDRQSHYSREDTGYQNSYDIDDRYNRDDGRYNEDDDRYSSYDRNGSRYEVTDNNRGGKRIKQWSFSDDERQSSRGTSRDAESDYHGYTRSTANDSWKTSIDDNRDDWRYDDATKGSSEKRRNNNNNNEFYYDKQTPATSTKKMANQKQDDHSDRDADYIEQQQKYKLHPNRAERDDSQSESTSLRRKRSLRREARIQHDVSDDSAEHALLEHVNRNEPAPADTTSVRSTRKMKLGDEVRQADQSTSSDGNRSRTSQHRHLEDSGPSFESYSMERESSREKEIDYYDRERESSYEDTNERHYAGRKQLDETANRGLPVNSGQSGGMERTKSPAEQSHYGKESLPMSSSSRYDDNNWTAADKRPDDYDRAKINDEIATRKKKEASQQIVSSNREAGKLSVYPIQQDGSSGGRSPAVLVPQVTINEGSRPVSPAEALLPMAVDSTKLVISGKRSSSHNLSKNSEELTSGGESQSLQTKRKGSDGGGSSRRSSTKTVENGGPANSTRPENGPIGQLPSLPSIPFDVQNSANNNNVFSSREAKPLLPNAHKGSIMSLESQAISSQLRQSSIADMRALPVSSSQQSLPSSQKQQQQQPPYEQSIRTMASSREEERSVETDYDTRSQYSPEEITNQSIDNDNDTSLYSPESRLAFLILLLIFYG